MMRASNSHSLRSAFFRGKKYAAGRAGYLTRGRLLLTLSRPCALKSLIASLEMAPTYVSDSWPGYDGDSQAAER